MDKQREAFEAWRDGMMTDASSFILWACWQAATAAERERAAKDARRYQWIRSRCRSDAFDAGVEWEWYEQDPDTLDAAIDAAMKE